MVEYERQYEVDFDEYPELEDIPAQDLDKELEYTTPGVVQAGILLGIEIEDVFDKYIGSYNNNQEYLEETIVCCEDNEFLLRYLDWDKIEQDYMADVVHYDGHYFYA